MPSFPLNRVQPFCVQNTLGAADTTKELLAAATGVSIVVTNLYVLCLIAAAQTAFVGDSSGTVKVADIRASFPQDFSIINLALENGLELTEGESLVVEPAAAGPSFYVAVSGYLKRGDLV